MPSIRPFSEDKVQIKPIENASDIAKLRDLLKSKIKHALLFELAIGTGMNAKQLLQLKVRDLDDLINGKDSIGINGIKKSGQKLQIDKSLIEVCHRYLKETAQSSEDYVFKSRKGAGPLTVASASRLVKDWFQKLGLNGFNGLLTLRKTWKLHFKLKESQIIQKTNTILTNDITGEYFKPIQAPTINEVVYQSLEQAIVSGQIVPGCKLVVEKLSRQMKVSSIPIREALARLEARNLITIIPNKGAVVKKLSNERIHELLEIRMILEIAAAEKTIPLIREETLCMLEKINNEYISAWKTWDVDNLLTASKKFHDCLYQDADLPILRKMINQVWYNVSPYYHLMFKNSQTRNRYSGANAHQKIIQGMRERNRKKVIHWLKKDLREAAEFVF